MSQSQQSQNQQQRIDDLENQLTDLQDKLDFQTAQYERNASVNAYKLRAVKQEVTEKEKQLKDLKAKIHTANSNVKEREAYLENQEESIAIAMEIANKRLLDLNEDIGFYQKELFEFKQEYVELDKAITDMRFTLESEKAVYESDLGKLHDQRNELLVDISNLKDKIKKLNKDYDSKIEKLDNKLKKIKERQTAVDVKYEVLISERIELEEEKRRFNMEKRVYEM